MRPALAVALKEIRSQAASPVGWVVAAGYLLLGGYFFFGLVDRFAATFRSYATWAPTLTERINLNDIVVAGLARNLLVLLLFVVPILTMRSFAEERRQGTDELLLTAPAGVGEIVLGKYLGLLAVASSWILASVTFPLILLRYGDPETGPIWTAWLGLLLATSAMVALGIAVSASTDSQVVAGIGSFVLLLMLFVVDWPSDSVSPRLGAVLKGISLPGRFDGFSRGVVSSGDVVYYLSLAALGLFSARAIVASQRWR
ncbi:MAG: ABC transporter permease subunit [Acidobacteriia bacterium]|nr:ABC transporter permease subunit [Terriglobia bacterium]